MTDTSKDTWYYVIVQNPGTGDEQIVGYQHPETGSPFIPAFSSKEISQECFLLMPKDVMTNKYESQAFIKEDLIQFADKNGHDIFVLDAKGSFIEELS